MIHEGWYVIKQTKQTKWNVFDYFMLNKGPQWRYN